MKPDSSTEKSYLEGVLSKEVAKRLTQSSGSLPSTFRIGSHTQSSLLAASSTFVSSSFPSAHSSEYPLKRSLQRREEALEARVTSIFWSLYLERDLSGKERPGDSIDLSGMGNIKKRRRSREERKKTGERCAMKSGLRDGGIK